MSNTMTENFEYLPFEYTGECVNAGVGIVRFYDVIFIEKFGKFEYGQRFAEKYDYKIKKGQTFKSAVVNFRTSQILLYDVDEIIIITCGLTVSYTSIEHNDYTN